MFLYILLTLHSTTLIAGQLTAFNQWPGYNNMRSCAQLPFGCLAGCPDVYNQIGCSDVYCVCEHFSLEAPIVSSAASSYCSGNSQDIASATSIFNGFCAQLQVTVTGPQSPTATSANVASSTVTPQATTLITSITVQQATTLITSVTIQQSTSTFETSIVIPVVTSIATIRTSTGIVVGIPTPEDTTASIQGPPNTALTLVTPDPTSVPSGSGGGLSAIQKVNIGVGVGVGVGVPLCIGALVLCFFFRREAGRRNPPGQMGPVPPYYNVDPQIAGRVGADY